MTLSKYFSILAAMTLGGWLSLDIGAASLKSGLYSKTYSRVCELVRDNYYEPSNKLDAWVAACFTRAQHFGADQINTPNTLSQLIRSINGFLDRLAVSHLSIWDPTSMRSQWFGEARETGIRVRLIKGHFIITKLIDNGPGQLAGLMVGDEIVSINNKPLQTLWDVRSLAGRYLILRRDGGDQNQVPINEGLIELEKDVATLDIKTDSHPTLEIIPNSKNKKTGVLTIPSFVSNYFEPSYWNETIQQSLLTDKLIVDLRENSGGNFAAMLRALSPFFCTPTVVGQLIKPRHANGSSEELEDNVDVEYQTQLIDRAYQINLKTFEGYPCYKGDVVVLIDHESASTAEVFAQAFTLRPRSKIMGNFSAGEVVQAVWHPLPLGSGFALSIPDSMYTTIEGQNLEGVGVRPTKILEYNLDLARDGIDSWLLDSL